MQPDVEGAREPSCMCWPPLGCGGHGTSSTVGDAPGALGLGPGQENGWKIVACP